MRINQTTKKEQRIIPSLLAMVLASATTTSFAAGDTASVKVVGTILPAACQINVGNNGAFEFGPISDSSLIKFTYTLLEPKQLDLTINCTGPATVLVWSTDNRPVSILPIGSIGNGLLSSYGLGLVDNKIVGSYRLRMEPDTFIADGRNVSPITTNWTPAQPSRNWISYDGIAEGEILKKQFVSWGIAGGLTPLPFSSLRGKISATVFINTLADLPPLNKPIPFDGSATLQLFYFP